MQDQLPADERGLVCRFHTRSPIQNHLGISAHLSQEHPLHCTSMDFLVLSYTYRDRTHHNQSRALPTRSDVKVVALLTLGEFAKLVGNLVVNRAWQRCAVSLGRLISVFASSLYFARDETIGNASNWINNHTVTLSCNRSSLTCSIPHGKRTRFCWSLA